MAIPKPEDGEMEIWSSTQNTTETQAYAAQATGVAANKIVSKVKRLGVSIPMASIWSPLTFM